MAPLFNRLIVFFVGLMPKALVRRFSRKYIAGDSVGDAIRVVKELNAKGIMATLDVLGEEIDNLAQARIAVDEYKKCLQEISDKGLDANISLKPTQFGLGLDKNVAEANIREVLEEARKYNIFVRIDMEDVRFTSDTYAIYLGLKRVYPNIGTVMQAYLRRSHDDLSSMVDEGINLRLCKGIYVEARTDAYKQGDIINRNYALLLEEMLRHGVYVGIATHDELLVWEGIRLVRQYQREKVQYEFQMLLGVDHELRDIVVSQGHRLRVYVPYGVNWYHYAIRRLRENPQIAGHAFRSFFGLK